MKLTSLGKCTGGCVAAAAAAATVLVFFSLGHFSFTQLINSAPRQLQNWIWNIFVDNVCLSYWSFKDTLKIGAFLIR